MERKSVQAIVQTEETFDHPNLSQYGISDATKIYYNPGYELLFEHETDPALEGYERAVLTESDAVSVNTGEFTGRSPKDKYLVKDDSTRDTVWWSDQGANDNKPIGEVVWLELKNLVTEQLSGKTLYVVDAYCGIGTISLPLAALGFDVIGLELHQGSVDQALLNAMRNNLSDQCRFRAGDVVDLLEAALVGADALVLDPPRRGLDARVVQTILDTPPQRLAYLSCDPATQARDLKMLTEPDGPYRLKKHQPVDFFPQTTHLESLALLERVSSEAQL